MSAFTSVQVIAAPLSKRPGRFEVRLANGKVLVASSREPFSESACRLFQDGADPNTPLIMKRAGSDAVTRRSTVGAAPDLKAWLAPIAAKYGLTADDTPDRLDANGLNELLERLTPFKLDYDTESQISAAAYILDDPSVTVLRLEVVRYLIVH
jgi:hypothetical protein